MTIEVDLPDGSVAEFPAGTNPDVMKAAIQKRFPSKSIGRDVVEQGAMGFNRAVDALYNLPNYAVNIAASQLGYEPPIRPVRIASKFNEPDPYRKIINDISEAVGAQAPFQNVAPDVGPIPPSTKAGRYAGAIGEQLGGSIIPAAGLIRAGIVPATSAFLKQGLSSAAGAGVASQLARENELGLAGEIGAAIAGGFAGPAIYNQLARWGSSVPAAARYSQGALARAQDPERAALETTADRMVKMGVSPEDLREAVVPKTSPALTKRGFTREDMTNIVMRQLRGESAENVAKDYAHLVDAQGRKFSAATARGYLTEYEAANPTPVNIADIATELKGAGAAQPLLRLQRSAQTIGDDPVTAQRILNRQIEQPGRVAEIVEQSGGGRNYDDRIAELHGALKVAENEAYGAARASAKPLELRPVISEFKGRFPLTGGQLSETMNKAVELFFKKGYAAEGKQGTRFTRLLRPVDNVDDFLARRDELDQLIATSYKDGRATPLTKQLTIFRGAINREAGRSNPALREADALFSGNRTAEKLLERGADMSLRLSANRTLTRDFAKLTPEQQELVRVGFERNLAERALEVRGGAAAANQFSTEAFKRIVRMLYPGGKGAPAREIQRRGQALIRNLNIESITTANKNFVFGGSQTAEKLTDASKFMAPVRAAADLVTGRIGNLLENLSVRLAHQIGEKSAREIAQILSETNPPEMLRRIDQLAKYAKTSAEREAYVMALREARKLSLPNTLPAIMSAGVPRMQDRRQPPVNALGGY